MGSTTGRLAAAHDRWRARGPGSPLYLPSPTALRLAAMGHDSTVADLIYLWSIQWFAGPYSPNDPRKAWVGRVYDAITDLDPHFQDAYWLGYVSLLDDARDLAAAYALVDKALANDPHDTVLALDAAMTARSLKDSSRVQRYLLLAGRIGGDPLAERLLAELQDADTTQDELAAWRRLLSSSDAHNRAVATARVRDLTVTIDVARLQALAACYARRKGLRPPTLDALLHEGYLRETWLDPDGNPYVYDAKTGSVRSRTPPQSATPSRARRGVDLSDLGGCAPPPGTP